MKNNKLYISALIGFTAGMVSLSANAVDIPSVTESQIIPKRFQDGPGLRITDEVLIQNEDEQPDRPDAAGINLQLNSIEIDGNTVYNNGELEAIYAEKLGKTITLADIYDIRDAITKLYREDGYILSRAILPPQRIQGGNIKIRIIEGYLNDVSTQGEFHGNQMILDNYLGKIRTSGPLNSKNLERYLLLINDLHGTDANAVIRPADSGTGAADLVIVLDHDFVEGQIALDNSGTKFTGEQLLSGEFSSNSIFRGSEQITFRTIFDTDFEELAFGDFTYRQPIGFEGTLLRFNVGKTRTTPGSTLTSLDIEGETEIGEIEVTHPFIRSRRENLTARLSFTARDGVTDSGNVAVFDDSTRVAVIGLTYDFADSWDGVNLFDFAVHQGLDVFGASDEDELTSRSNGKAEFTKVTMEATRLQRLTDDLSFYFATEGQYSFDPLLVGEEFGIGGEYGRGFDFSELTGDHGIAAQFELQTSWDVDYDILQDYQLYMFYDIGSIWQEDKIVGEQSRQSLASLGTGFRFNFVDDLSGTFQLSKPLTREVNSEGDDNFRAHFSLNWIF